MKLLGAILLLTAGTMTGCGFARQLDEHTRRLRRLRQLVTAMMTELQGSLPLISQLLRQLAQQHDFHSLIFLQQAAANAEQFPACWAAALEADPTLTEEESAVLETVGQTLGSTTLDGQLAALALCNERLAALLEHAAETAKTKGNLYRRIGVLGGMFLVILLL